MYIHRKTIVEVTNKPHYRNQISLINNSIKSP